LAKDVLKNATQPLSVSEIWSQGIDLGLINKLPCVGKTPEATLGARLYTDTKYNGERSDFIRVSSRPTLFTLKIVVNFSNLREYYFQAVSNSSWANEGYLVAIKYDQAPEFIDEMRRLNNAFGIGFIQLNLDDCFQSEIVLSARNNENLDWNTIDRLIEDNEDFRQFTNSIEMSLRNDELCKKENFDALFTDLDEYVEYVKNKKIVAF
jgi:hypothetical protein